MNDETLLAELEAVAEKLAVEIVYDRFTGDAAGTGGICKVRGKWRVIIERRCSPGERLSVLAQALTRFDMEEVFLSPGLRSLLERYKPAGSESEVAAEPEPTDSEAAAEPAEPADSAVETKAETGEVNGLSEVAEAS
jgi:hypothetical protein